MPLIRELKEFALSLSQPRLKTVKRLFAVSKNRCAFEGCKTALIDAQGIVTGEICHIKARHADGPRFDRNQSHEERHAFENLVLMCGVHHKVIDEQPIAEFTVERVQQLKAQHEAGTDHVETSDDVANAFLANSNLTADVPQTSKSGGINVIANGNVVINQSWTNSVIREDTIAAERIARERADSMMAERLRGVAMKHTQVVATKSWKSIWLSKICEHFEATLRIRGPYSSEPDIQLLGEYQLTEAQKSRAEQIFAGLEFAGKYNDPHAFVVGTPIWDDSPLQLRLRTLDYASLLALRESGDKFPPILSANAMVVSAKMQKLVLSRRSATVDHYPDLLHTVGGAFQPHFHVPRSRVDASLRATARSEFDEELQGNISLNDAAVENIPMFAFEELDVGFIQWAFLGVKLLDHSLASLKANWEGNLVELPFNQLCERLERTDCWVPSGKAAVLLWLAMGAPGLKPETTFGGFSAEDILERVIG